MNSRTPHELPDCFILSYYLDCPLSWRTRWHVHALQPQVRGGRVAARTPEALHLTSDDFQVFDSDPMSAAGDPMGDGCGCMPEELMLRLLQKRCLCARAIGFLFVFVFPFLDHVLVPCLVSMFWFPGLVSLFCVLFCFLWDFSSLPSHFLTIS